MGPLRMALLVGAAAIGTGALASCTTVDPGPNFVIPNTTFNANYFYCHVEPELIFAKKCGDNKPGSCHFNSSAVSGMALIQHAAIDCGGGDAPVNPSDVGLGTPAEANYTSVSLDMSRDYLTSGIYVRPLCSDSSCATGHGHPLGLFNESDPVVDVIKTWAQKP
jgi:hypothetical protein